jgi:hypothetical protein
MRLTSLIALLLPVYVVFAGCAAGPSVRVEGEAIRFKPAARGEFVGPYTLADGDKRWAIKPMRQSGDEWLVPIADIGPATAGRCLVVADARGRIIPLRSGADPSRFMFGAYAELGVTEQQWVDAQGRLARARANVSEQQEAYRRAVSWLNDSPYFRDNQCVRPVARAAPARPAGACEPAGALDRGRDVCLAAAVAGEVCSQQGNRLTATQRQNGLEALASKLAVSATCAAVGAAIQGEAPSVAGWLADALIDGPFFDCMTQAMRPGAPPLASLGCAVPGLFFAAKLEECAKGPAERCSNAYYAWQNQANQARSEPDQVLATCQNNVRLRDRGLAGTRDIEQELIPAAERWATEARKAHEAAVARAKNLSASAQHCAAK